MRNFKKIIAVLVTITMLLGTVALSASAGEAPYVVLVGRTQMEADDTYEADLMVSGAETGGVQGTIVYDTNYFVYAGIEFSEEFEDANKGTTDAVKVDEAAGTIAFIGINPGNDVVWFTLKFTAKENTGDASFVIDETENAFLKLMSSKIDGKDVWTKTFFDAPAVELVTPGQIDMLGGTIKTTTNAGKQDIRFNVSVNKELDIVEYGVIFLPSQLLKGQELLADPDTVYGYNSKGTPIKAAIAKADSIGDNEKFYATLTGSSSYKEGTLRQVDISSRAYIKLSDGTVEYLDALYSNNDLEDTAIDNGYARKSIIGIAKSMASAVIADSRVTYTEKLADAEAVKELINKEILDENNSEHIEENALLEFIVTNKELIKTLIEERS